MRSRTHEDSMKIGSGLELSFFLCLAVLLALNDLTNRSVVQPEALPYSRETVAGLDMRCPDGLVAFILRGHLLGRQDLPQSWSIDQPLHPGNFLHPLLAGQQRLQRRLDELPPPQHDLPLHLRPGRCRAHAVLPELLIPLLCPSPLRVELA